MRHKLFFLISIVIGAKAIATAPDLWHAKARTLFEHAISIPTVAGRGKVPELAAYLAEQYRAAGISESDIKIMPYNDTAALIVRWRAPGKAIKKPIMLMGHMDVVEAKREDWTMDPFTLIEKDGYFYGRGTSDMKNGLVATTIAILKLKADGFKPNRDILIFFSGDEETLGKGAENGASIWKSLLDPEFGLNADGGGGGFTSEGRSLGFSIQTTEKTYADYEFMVRNKGGHSSKPRPDNAIYQLAGALKRLEAYRFEPSLNETTRAYFGERQKTERGPLGNAMRAWLKNPNDGKAADVIEADPNETGLTRTRCVATRLFGGHADNALPQLATANVNCRIMPGVAPQKIKAELERVVSDPGVLITQKENSGGDGGVSPLRGDVVEAFTAAVHAKFPDAPIIPKMSAGASDALFFRRAGIPIYGVNGAWGIVPDDMRAHGRDERIKVQAFYDNIDHWTRLLTILAQ